jgi:hypothetical protein
VFSKGESRSRVVDCSQFFVSSVGVPMPIVAETVSAMRRNRNES